ncbi:amidohydrolase family protein [Terracidiphilus gabretensis]|uniref:amidohydrolase family protein n=1 Tax=Terracidiphilus gabretensis TaxID=1577687 RepID=UPI000A47196D|nr:amidohydrolase family protein [Terracidiphilus gabretensis]
MELSPYTVAMQARRVLFLLFVGALFSSLPGLCSDLALIHAKVYPSPAETPIENGTILMRNGRIVEVGPTGKVKVPRDATLIDCKGMAVTAGFWNSHVHILIAALLHSEKISGDELTAQLQEIFTRWGFTTVFDIASIQRNSMLIRRRIESGEVKGPRILTVGEPFWVKGGTPVYVKDFLETNHVSIPEVESAAQATERVRQQVRDGADGIKIFVDSIEENGILTMPVDLAKAIVSEAHRAGKPVFAHVSTTRGIEVALESGVDILAHTTPFDDAWSPSLVGRLAAAHMALTPTLTLWDIEAKKQHAPSNEIEKGMAKADQQLQSFSQAGGQILFGTDVGYIYQFDTSEEFMWMSRGGMSFQRILASLTTNPTARFGYSSHSGRIAKGMDADLVVLDGDPGKDITAFSKIHEVVRGGHSIYSAP